MSQVLNQQTPPPRFPLFVLSCAFVVLALTGTKECQKDYFYATQTSGVATPTPTSDDDDTISATETFTPTEDSTETPTETSTEEAEEEATATSTPTATTPPVVEARTAFLKELASITDMENRRKNEKDNISGAPKKAPLPSENWLGNLYAKNGANTLDSDDDGYGDKLEKELGTNLLSASSFPLQITSSRLSDRIFEKGNPKPDFENEGAELLDSDKDGLDDGLEKILGSNIHLNDSDGDEILDGREYLLGSDPIIPDLKR